MKVVAKRRKRERMRYCEVSRNPEREVNAMKLWR